jgi:hypothetical protein
MKLTIMVSEKAAYGTDVAQIKAIKAAQASAVRAQALLNRAAITQDNASGAARMMMVVVSSVMTMGSVSWPNVSDQATASGKRR